MRGSGYSGRGATRHSFQQTASRIGLLSTWLFGLSLALFTLQAVSPDIRGIPVQAWLVWLVFTKVALFGSFTMKSMRAVFSGWQWRAIGVLVATVVVRSALDGWNILRFGQLITGIMIGCVGVSLSNRAVSEINSSGTGSQCDREQRGRDPTILSSTLWLWTWTKYAGIGYIYGSTGLEYYPVSYAYSVLGIGTMLFGSWMIYQRDGIKLLPLCSSAKFYGSLIIAGRAFVE
ncbi:MAG: hypothetical protein KatS3mg081_0018 [Gemmatimonadales bacterium]|nr:MAG: hypothetical protein KatS3mg081_0018 [Gemmatimonadales bacterium]